MIAIHWSPISPSWVEALIEVVSHGREGGNVSVGLATLFPTYFRQSNYRMQGHLVPAVLHVLKSFEE